MAQLWPLYKWLDQIERQKAPGYTAAIAEAEGASEGEAALALKHDAVSAHWAWGGDGFLRNRSEMMRTINGNRVMSNVPLGTPMEMVLRRVPNGETWRHSCERK